MTIKNLMLSGLAAIVMNGCTTEGVNPVPTPATYCSKDTDCKGERICDKGVCVDQVGSDGSNNTLCGNSPLYGKYLWHVNCELGTSKVFDNTCKGYVIEDSGVEDIVTYNGLVLNNQGMTLSLIRNFSCDQAQDPKNLCLAYKCALAKNPSLYVLKSDIEGLKLGSTLWEIKDQPWMGKTAKSQCFDTIKKEDWYINCFESNSLQP